MKDEIKEINIPENVLVALGDLTNGALNYYKATETVKVKHNIILDYITNLQEQLEDLKEDNYAYRQLMKMQNKREYRSKFLKEFQEEFNTNTFPDYDEIYKRYDKLKKENEKLKEENFALKSQII